MSTIQNFKLFQLVISNAFTHLGIQRDTTHNYGGFTSKLNYFPFYARRKMLVDLKMEMDTLLLLGVQHSSPSLSQHEQNVVFAYEHSVSYAALIGLTFLCRHAATDAYVHMSKIAGKNKQYIYQVLSEHATCSTTTLDILATAFAAPVQVLLDIANILLNNEDDNTKHVKLTNIFDSINFNSANTIPLSPVSDNLYERVNTTYALRAGISYALRAGIGIFATQGTWDVSILIKDAGIRKDISIKLWDSKTSQTYNAPLKAHLAIAEQLQLPLHMLYAHGIRALTVGLLPAIPNISEDIKSKDISARRHAVAAYRCIVETNPTIPVKSLLSEMTDIGPPQLSKILTISDIPSVKVLTKIASAFSLSYDELVHLGQMNIADMTSKISIIMSADSTAINKHIHDKNTYIVLKTHYISALLECIHHERTAHTLYKWAKEHNISISCIRNLLNRRVHNAKSSIRKILTALDLSEIELFEIGENLGTLKNIVATKQLLLSKFDISNK